MNSHATSDSDHRDDGQQEIDGPKQLVLADAVRRQLFGTDGNDADHRSADAVKYGLHPREAAEMNISPAKRDDHQKRRHHDGDSGQGRAQRAIVNVTHVDAQLRRQRPWRQLGQGKSLFVIGLRDPFAPLDQVAVHIPDQRDRATEARTAKSQHVQDHLPDGVNRFALVQFYDAQHMLLSFCRRGSRVGKIRVKGVEYGAHRRQQRVAVAGMLAGAAQLMAPS